MAATRLRTSYRPRVAILAIAGLLLLAVFGFLLWDAFRSEARIAGQVAWPYGRANATGQAAQVEVIRNQREFTRAVGLTGDGKSRHQLETFLTNAFRIKAVNFNRQMLLIVRGDVKLAGVDDVAVTRAVFDKGRDALMVHWVLRPCVPGQPAFGKPTAPATLVLLERFDGDVTLAPTPDP
jgi:hypothetical protein